MIVAIAAQACLPVLNLSLELYRGWVGVIVYPGEFVIRKTVEDEAGVVHEIEHDASGEAWEGGPVVLSWEDAQMTDGARIMQGTYAQAVGSDPARQRALSPYFQAGPPNVRDFLVLHVDRDDGRRQSEALAAALRTAGSRVELDALAGRGLMGHMAINRQLGEADYPGTAIVDRWVDGVLGK